MHQKTYLTMLVSGYQSKRCFTYNGGTPCGCDSTCIYGPSNYDYNGCSGFSVYWNIFHTKACCFVNSGNNVIQPIQCPSCIWPPYSPCSAFIAPTNYS